MTTNEVQHFRKTLTARVAELERITRQREGITIERTAEADGRNAVGPRNVLLPSAISAAIAANSGTPVRLSVEFGMGASGYVSGAMRTSIRSASRQCHGPPLHPLPGGPRSQL